MKHSCCVCHQIDKEKYIDFNISLYEYIAFVNSTVTAVTHDQEICTNCHTLLLRHTTEKPAFVHSHTHSRVTMKVHKNESADHSIGIDTEKKTHNKWRYFMEVLL